MLLWSACAGLIFPLVLSMLFYFFINTFSLLKLSVRAERNLRLSVISMLPPPLAYSWLHSSHSFHSAKVRKIKGVKKSRRYPGVGGWGNDLRVCKTTIEDEPPLAQPPPDKRAAASLPHMGMFDDKRRPNESALQPL